LVNLSGTGVKGGLLIYLGAYGLKGQLVAFTAWSEGFDMPAVAFWVLAITALVYAYLARIKMRWLAIPLCSLIAGVVAYLMGAPFEFTTEPGLPHMSPFYWWGADTGWQLGLPNFQNFVAVLPFAVLAVAMWSPDIIGHRVFQELHYPPKAKAVLMDIDNTLEVVSVRQLVGTGLGGGNLASSWGTYMIPAAIAKRPIPGGAILTAVLCVVVAIAGAPMDLAMWEPILRVALVVGVFLPLLETGMEMIKDKKSAQVAGTVIFISALVNPVIGWSLTMLMDNCGFLGRCERSDSLPVMDRYVLPLITFLVCFGAMVSVGLIPGL
jgi:hypothetical protein